MFVLRLTDRRHRGRTLYVNQDGSAHAYTVNPLRARTWPTRAAAETDRCPDNEAVEDVGAALDRYAHEGPQ